jgi:2-hydroxychromene-2-carboxylate isomerase
METLPGEPVLYFDLASPYGYLAVMRAASVLGRPVALEPILLGAMFKWRGSGSWAATPARNLRMSEIENRARSYGLEPMRWPAQWPANSLAAMRAAVWARDEGRLDAFADAVYRAEFARGADIADVDLLADCADHVGLDGAALPAAITRADIKQRLRRATQSAWEAGVRGVPTLVDRGTVFFGDDQLELAAASTSMGL